MNAQASQASGHIIASRSPGSAAGADSRRFLSSGRMILIG
jgi:hypothetical protein